MAEDENELYERWLATEPGNRGDIEERLYAAVRRHAQAVLWNQLNEPTPELADDVVNAVMIQLRKFRRDSKFSTWVEGIARLKAKQYIRGKVAARRVFDEYMAVVEDNPANDDYGKSRVGQVTPIVLPQFDTAISARQLRESLGAEDAIFLQQKAEGLQSKEIAEATGSTVEAVDSRWARLKRRAKKFLGPRRK